MFVAPYADRMRVLVVPCVTPFACAASAAVSRRRRAPVPAMARHLASPGRCSSSLPPAALHRCRPHLATTLARRLRTSRRRDNRARSPHAGGCAAAKGCATQRRVPGESHRISNSTHCSAERGGGGLATHVWCCRATHSPRQGRTAGLLPGRSRPAAKPSASAFPGCLSSPLREPGRA